MRVLVVDDSTIFRKVVRDALDEAQGIEVVGVACDGQAALDKIAQLKPDLLTLDIEMPVLNGLQVLERLQTLEQRPEVIMLSSLTEQGASVTTQALRLGAFDFCLKPNQSSLEASSAQLRANLLPKVETLLRRSRRVATAPAVEAEPVSGGVNGQLRNDHRAIALGISTGGPQALSALLPKLPADFPVPIFIVQHMPPLFTQSLANDLNRSCKMQVCEATNGQTVEPGVAYIAPGGRQMKITLLNGRQVIQVTEDPPEKNCRPSVDYLFRSVSLMYGGDALGVIMTGMGDDGTVGSNLLKRRGSGILVQDEASCVVYGMPRQVVDAGLADVVSPLHRLHEYMLDAVGAGVH